jgi:CRP-like cAMP-binding protein
MVSKSGKEATITLLAKGDLVGEEALAEASGLRVASATTLTECAVLRIEGREMRRVMRGEPKLADLLLAQLLARIVRAQADLADQLFNSSEKRLARALLLMAEGVEGDVSKMQLPQVTQGTLADMIGTTRSRVSFFMNRFRERGFIEYDRRIRVNKSLLNRVLSE